jgi:histone-lysine N-methyltransferase SETD2
MSDSEGEKKTARLEPELRDMKLEEGATPIGDEGEDIQVKAEDADVYTPSAIPPRLKSSRSKSQSPMPKHESEASSPADSTKEEVVGGDILLKMEPGPGGKALKLSRSASQKVVSRPPPLYLDLPDSTEAAKETFVVLPECTYSNKHIGTTDPALECDCSEEWGR